MRALVFGLILASLAGAAQARPYGGGFSSADGTFFHDQGTLGPIRTPSAALPQRDAWTPHRQPSRPSMEDPRPFKPYKGIRIYGDDPTSLAPGPPIYAPGFKPFKPILREGDDPYGRSRRRGAAY